MHIQRSMHFHFRQFYLLSCDSMRDVFLLGPFSGVLAPNKSEFVCNTFKTVVLVEWNCSAVM